MADQPASADEEKTLDALFNGRKKTVKGRLVIEYLTGEEEKAALRIVARLLRAGDLLLLLRSRLAGLLDPDIRPIAQPRKLAFAPRRQHGRKGHEDISRYIARDIMHAAITGQKLEPAFADAADKYGVSRRTVIRAWNKYKKHPVMAEFIRQEQERFRSSDK
jgi:hypothetical protein